MLESLDIITFVFLAMVIGFIIGLIFYLIVYYANHSP